LFSLFTVTAFLCACRTGDSQVESEFAVITDLFAGVGYDSTGRSVAPIEVHYKLTRPFSAATLEFLTRDSITSRFPLPDLSVGKHVMTVPPGIRDPFNPPTFSCGFATAPILTLGVESIRSFQDSSTLYDYVPDPTPENSPIRLDLAASFRGKEIGASAVNIRAPHNDPTIADGAIEVEILGVNLTDGMEVSCYRGQPILILVKTQLRDVKVVSTISHEDNEHIPVLQAARFFIPPAVLERLNSFRIVGVVKQ
jgi:hypothetical protein